MSVPPRSPPSRSRNVWPAPPWNDEIMHEYHFTVYALDVESLDLSGAFSGQDALAAMEGHILAKGGVMGLYTLTPSLM